MSSFPFARMEATGNDFIVVYRHDLPHDIGPNHSPSLCDRSHGEGADGVLVIGFGPSLPPSYRQLGVTASMTLWNADGSEAEMCGNGLRAIALLLHLDGHWDGNGVLQIGSPAGVVMARLVRPPVEQTAQLELALAAPQKLERDSLEIRAGGHRLQGRRIDMGNPHFVLFQDEQLAPLPDLSIWGAAAEHAAEFPDRSNVEWAMVEGPQRIRLRVWERGVGETLACGSGACATAIAARISGRIKDDPVQVILPGGSLQVSWAGGPSDPVLLQGAATLCYRANWTEPR